MKNKLQKIKKSNLKLSMITIFMVAVALYSCTKPGGSNGAAQFIGTWNMTSACGGSAPIIFGGTGNTVTTTGTIGGGSCAKSITYTGTVSGKGFTIPSATYTDNCGVSYTVSGTGTLNGSTLSLTITIVGEGTCTFSGTK